MKEQIVEFNTAKLAKEKGFNLYQPNQYSGTNTVLYNYIEATVKLYNDIICAPTQSLLQKWLREVHKIHIQIENVNVPEKEKWIYEIMRLPVGVIVLWNEETSLIFDTYEQALEIGLQEGLKLIK